MKPASMGITSAEIELVRAADLILVQEGYLQPDQVRLVKHLALVDSGASMLAVTESRKPGDSADAAEVGGAIAWFKCCKQEM